MDTRRTLLQFISALPAIIVGLAALVFPEFAFVFLVAFVVLLFVAIGAWAYITIQELKRDNFQLRAQLAQRPAERPELKHELPPAQAVLTSTPIHAPPPPPLPPRASKDWEMLEEIDLLLDVLWERTKTFHFAAGTTVRTTASGRNRFIIHLAEDVQTPPNRKKWSFNSIENSAETMKLTRNWNIKQEGDYTFVLDPVGNAPFHVLVRVEQTTTATG